MREEREEMIPPHTSWTGLDALFSSMRPQSSRAYRVRIVFFRVRTRATPLWRWVLD